MLPPTLKAQFAHPDLQSGKKVVPTVLMLPAQANVVKSGVMGTEPLVQESNALASNFGSWVASDLTGVGCAVLPNGFSDESLNQNPDLKYALSDLQVRFDKVWD